MISKKVTLQKIDCELTRAKEIELYILRTDLIHPAIGGNKLFKLKYNLLKAKAENKNLILTFGGAYSNHIAATAAAGNEQGFSTIGIIRGEDDPENPTLQFARNNGMQLRFYNRSLYRDKIALQKQIENEYPAGTIYTIPEGGSNKEGVIGCKEITELINIPFNAICCPCGTGTTLAGITLSLSEGQRAIGFQVLKGEGYIRSEVEQLLNQFDSAPYKNWRVEEDFHFGGYAKVNQYLINFISSFEKEHHIPL
ncbi:MAG: pyridoxal-phosphate dependent enzyme, partial [Bacteroidota bacterium]|nr:pyridoxal-phosphate dependent enzyme [Bacteroidota bacterium]